MQNSASKIFNSKNIKTVVKLTAIFALSFVLVILLQIDKSKSLPSEKTVPIGADIAQASNATNAVAQNADEKVVTVAHVQSTNLELNKNSDDNVDFFSFFGALFSDEEEEHEVVEAIAEEIIVEEVKPKVPSVEHVQSKVYASYYELCGFVLEGEDKVFYGEVAKGDTISTLLNSWVTNAQISEAMKIAKPMLNLTNINLGNPYAIVLDRNNKFKRFEYEVSSEMLFTLNATVLDDDLGKINAIGEYSKYAFTADFVPLKFEIELALIKGEIDSSLFEAVVDAKGGASLVPKIVDVFAYQIDFFRDIRSGDSFEILIEKKYRRGEFYGYGDALAMIFVNKGEKFAAYQHKIEDKGRGYYDQNGDALERLLLRAPLNYSRISSGFTMSRKHPILDITRPHQGIDYAAPYGTPVRTVGDGSVKFVGWKGDYGNLVVVTHSNGLETQYAHLSKFVKGLKKGDRVRQGETIAYVGSTGLSTGPHLDFRLKQNGKFVNPQSVIIPKSPPLQGGEKEDFLQTLTVIQAYLDGTKALANYMPKAEVVE